jgi:hypothetical protein
MFRTTDQDRQTNLARPMRREFTATMLDIERLPTTRFEPFVPDPRPAPDQWERQRVRAPLTGWKRAGELRHTRVFWRDSTTELGLIRTGATGSGNGRVRSGRRPRASANGRSSK